VIDSRNAARAALRYTGSTAEHHIAETAAGSASLFVEEVGNNKPSKKKLGKSATNIRLNAAQLDEALQQKQAQVEAAWVKLAEADNEIRQGLSPDQAETKWLAEAEILVETFRTAREMFTTMQKVRANQ
jgi:hypothetical protein